MSEIQESVELLATTLGKKNHDYVGFNGGEFFNFEKAAEFAHLEVLDVMMAQIGIKLTRIQGLQSTVSGAANFESVSDSLLDLAGYAIIAHAYYGSRTVRDSEENCNAPAQSWNPAG